ncbi:MAG: nucleotide exchange factor GrpE [Clostridia bacterium]|nr:nucleotide exchange factor GrpE [Clostridia bacterium]
MSEKENTKSAEEKEEKKEKKSKKKADKADEKVAELQSELEEQKNQYLRLAAEYDNYRKRTQREKDALNGDIKAYIIGEILPVIDNFERATANTSADYETYKKGMEMIFTQFVDIFKKLGVEAFGEPGEAFDPMMHNAVMHIDSEDFDESVVAQVFAKGYKIDDKIIRCATVQVAN